LSHQAAIVGLAFVEEQLWIARQNGLVESLNSAETVSTQLEADPVGLVSQAGQLWVWGQHHLTRLDSRAKVVSQQVAQSCHSLCQRSNLLWTASDHEVCCYQLGDSGWELLRQFSQLQGCCLSFDISSKGDQFLRIWPGQGNRWHVATYDALSGKLKSEFKRGALWLQAVFCPNDFSLMVTGWSPQQVTAVSFSGGNCSDRHRLLACAWAGPIFHFDQRVVVICQGGLQSYDCRTFPMGRPEYAFNQEYQPGHPWVVPVGSKWRNHQWYQRYANRYQPKIEYARCPVTAVASHGSRIAVGHQDGTLRVHQAWESAAVPAAIPVRAAGQTPESLLLLDPRAKQLVEIAVVQGQTHCGAGLELDDYWPHSASDWGQIHRSQNSRLLLRDRYGTQCFQLSDGRLLWQQERGQWSLATRLLPWKDRLYLDQDTRGVAWIDVQDGRQHQLELDSPWCDGRIRLYSAGEQFLVNRHVAGANHWGLYRPEDESVQSLPVCQSWCDAAVSTERHYFTLCRHHVPNGQDGNLMLLDSSGLEKGRWLLPWCSQMQAEPSLNLIFGIAVQRLQVYDFEGNLVNSFQGHGSAIVGFQVDCQARSVLSWDEFGWVRRWSLA
jgi:hypothetical protein